MFKNKYYKAITFSFDDGVYQDKRVIEIMNKYNLKGTFNLNSGIQSNDSHWYHNNKLVQRMNIDEIVPIYKGHEIASHALTHPFLEQLEEAEVYKEITEDIKNLEKIFNTKIVGFAYPYGTYNDTTIKVLKDIGLRYARTVKDSQNFDISEDLLQYSATCHFLAPNIMELAKKFVEMKCDKPQVFYIWGHSFELDSYDCWDKFEELCAYISNKDDIFYGTNKEVLAAKE